LGSRGKLVLSPTAKNGVFMMAGQAEIKTEDLENNPDKAKALIANRVLRCTDRKAIAIFYKK
jgi:hypothetical protein